MAGLRDKVNKKVDQAFAKVDDLLVDAQFTTKSVTDFDLGSGTTVETPTVVITKRVFEEEKIIRSADGPVKVQQIFFRADGRDYSVYDKVIVNGVTLNVVTSVNNGYTVTMEVTRA